MVDYSEFSRPTLSTTKIAQHSHPDGSIHIEIDCIIPPEAGGVAKVIREKFDQLMRSLPGTTCVSSQSWSGDEAEAHNVDVNDYHYACQRDPRHEN